MVRGWETSSASTVSLTTSENTFNEALDAQEQKDSDDAAQDEPCNDLDGWGLVVEEVRCFDVVARLGNVGITISVSIVGENELQHEGEDEDNGGQELMGHGGIGYCGLWLRGRTLESCAWGGVRIVMEDTLPN